MTTDDLLHDETPRVPRAFAARRGVMLSLAALGLIIILAGVARTSAGRRATASLGIGSDREPYTALSFLNPGTVGSAGVYYHIAQIHDRLGFRIANDEHHAQRYGWTIDFDPAGRVYRGSVLLRPGASGTVSRTVLFPCDANVPAARRHLHMITVRVSLQPTGESIDFQQECDD